MKIWKLIALLLLTTCVAACDDDPKEEENGGNAGGSLTDQVNVGFGYDARTVLRNAGQVLVPVKLEKQVNNLVKVTVDAREGDADTDAREGIDFNIAEKVVTVPVGDTLAYVAIDLLDNAKANDDRVITLNITGVYGGKTGVQKSCLVHILSNSFVEFEKTVWETWESAAGASASEAVRNTRYVPLVITGEMTEASTVVLGVVDSTASEPIHFTVTKEITVQPGDSRVMVEISPIDDNDVNEDRVFTLYVKEVKGGNLCVGKTAQACRVKILSEEIRRTLSFGMTSAQVTDEAQEVLIPISLDKDPKVPMTVKITPLASSTAQKGSDYELESNVMIIENTNPVMVKVRILGDKELNGDRKLVLQFTDINGENVFINEKANTCTLDILNDDMTFDADVLEVAEDEVNHLTVTIPAVDRERTITVNFTETVAGAWLPVAAKTVTVPAGASEVNVPVEVKYTEAFPATLPVLKVKVVKMDNFVLEEPVQANLRLVPCAFRKLLGNWTMYAENPDNCVGTTNATITQVAWQKEVKVVSAGLWNKQNVYFNMIYDKETKGLKIVLNKQCEDHTWNFGGSNTSVVLRLLVDGKLNLTHIDMGGYDVKNGILTLPIDAHIGGGGAQSSMTANPSVWGFFFKNGRLVKK